MSRVDDIDGVSTVNMLQEKGALGSQTAIAREAAPAADSGRKLANPAPVGLVAFGITTIMLNFLNAGVAAGPPSGLS